MLPFKTALFKLSIISLTFLHVVADKLVLIVGQYVIASVCPVCAYFQLIVHQLKDNLVIPSV